MCVQKHKNVIRNVKGKKSLSGNAAATQGNLRLLSWRSENIESGKGWSAGGKNFLTFDRMSSGSPRLTLMVNPACHR